MENRMQIFQNEEFGRIRTFVTEDGVPWFVGKDVADNLGYQNGSRDINRHVAPEDRTKGMVFDGNQRKETILINESGLYSLILSSKLESAKRFKHWVTSEVLPSIRRHGAYMTDALLTVALPKAAYFDALVDCPDCTGIRLTAKELGVPQSMFTAYLVRKKYAYYDSKGIMHPHALPYRNGLFVVREFIAPNGHRGTQMLVTPKGKQVFLAERAEIIG